MFLCNALFKHTIITFTGTNNTSITVQTINKQVISRETKIPKKATKFTSNAMKTGFKIVPIMFSCIMIYIINVG